MEWWKKTSCCPHAAELMMGCGVLLVTVGAGMIYLPAGLITGVCWPIVGAVLSIIGGGEDV